MQPNPAAQLRDAVAASDASRLGFAARWGPGHKPTAVRFRFELHWNSLSGHTLGRSVIKRTLFPRKPRRTVSPSSARPVHSRLSGPLTALLSGIDPGSRPKEPRLGCAVVRIAAGEINHSRTPILNRLNERTFMPFPAGLVVSKSSYVDRRNCDTLPTTAEPNPTAIYLSLGESSCYGPCRARNSSLALRGD